jgi:hypothetical protein
MSRLIDSDVLRLLLAESCEHPGMRSDVHHLCRTCSALAKLLDEENTPPEKRKEGEEE